MGCLRPLQITVQLNETIETNLTQAVCNIVGEHFQQVGIFQGANNCELEATDKNGAKIKLLLLLRHPHRGSKIDWLLAAV